MVRWLFHYLTFRLEAVLVGTKVIIRQEGRGREKDAKDRKESMNGRKERDKKDICGNILNIKYHINK